MITKALSLFVLLTAWSVSAQTNEKPFCCRYPLRLIGETRHVNLTPLFQWWTSHDGQAVAPATTLQYNPGIARPLTAWKRITGVRTAVLGDFWVVNAEITFSPSSKTNAWIILKHPPVVEEQQYYYLQSQLAQYDQQIKTDDKIKKTDAEAAQRATFKAMKSSLAMGRLERADGRAYSQAAAQDNSKSEQALNEEKQSEQVRDQIRKQLEAMPGAQGRYQVDCFALEVGRNSKGQLIYDVGAAAGYSQ